MDAASSLRRQSHVSKFGEPLTRMASTLFHDSWYAAHFTAPLLDGCSRWHTSSLNDAFAFDTSRMLIYVPLPAAPTPNELNNYIPDSESKSRITMAHCKCRV